ncbi:MAG: hypothetical protein AB7I19_06530 [Planctomycetota bacterium]
MNSRIWIAVGAIVLLGGGSIGFVIWRGQAQAAEATAAVLEDARSELAQEQPSIEDLRRVLEVVRDRQKVDPSSDLVLAEAELLAATGRQRDGFERVEPLATAVGASAETLRVGAVVARAAHAATGTEAIGRQALAFGIDWEAAGGGTEASALVWQMAFRLGAVEEFAQRALVAFEPAASGRANVLMRSCSRPLAELLAARLGLEPSTSARTLDGPLGEVIAKGTVPTLRELADAAADWRVVPAELSLVTALVGLESASTDGADVALRARECLSHCDQALAAFPASVEARHIAVIAFAAHRQAGGLDAEDVRRLRGYLSWLSANGPKEHRSRGLWQSALSELGY